MYKPIFFKSLVLLSLLSFQIFAYAVESVSSLPACRDNVCRLIDAGGDAQSAIEQLKTLCAAEPNLPNALLDIAARYQMRKKYDQSTALYKSISAAYADKDIASRCRVQLSKIDILKLITAGSIAAAEQAVVRVETDFAGNKDLPVCLRNIAGRYEECGAVSQAKALYTKVIERYASDAVNSRHAAFQLARLGIYDLIEKKDFSGAQAAVKRYEADFAGYKDIPNRLCDIAERYEKFGGVEDAKALYGNVVKRYASDAVEGKYAALQLAKLDIYSLIEKKDFSAAQAAVKRMETDFAEHKRLPIRLYQTACRYERFGGAEQARALYIKIIERYAGDAATSRNAALQLAKLNICDLIERRDFSAAGTAIRDFKGTYAANPYFREGFFQIAGKCYEDGLKMSRQLPDADNVFFRQSLSILEDELLADVPDVLMRASISYVKGLNYEMLGEYQQAANSYQKAFEINPGHQYADYCVFATGRCYERLLDSRLISETQAKPVIISQYTKLLADYPQSRYAPYASGWLQSNK